MRILSSYHEPATDKDDDNEDILSSPGSMSPQSKPGPRPKLNGVDQLFLFLSWLRLGSPLKHTAWLFDLPKSKRVKICYHMGKLYLF